MKESTKQPVASGVTVIKNVSASVDGALQKLTCGELTPETPSPDEHPDSSTVPQWKLVDWAM